MEAAECRLLQGWLYYSGRERVEVLASATCQVVEVKVHPDLNLSAVS